MITDPEGLLRDQFGYRAFRPGQLEALQSLAQGHSTLVVMPTGAGKSLIYQLAALSLPGLTLVISPLIALMKDQVESLKHRNIPAAYLNSSQSVIEQNEHLRRVAQGEYRLLYIAPERLRNVAFTAAIRKRTISLLAVDEAHCISEWGHDFRPDYLYIAQARAFLGNPLTLALTATATPRVQADIIRLLDMQDHTQSIITGFNRPNLNLNVVYTRGIAAKLCALQELLAAYDHGPVILYAGTRRDAEEIAEFIRTVLKVPVEYYHAGLPAVERARVQDEFMSGRVNIIAATNAFGMGIDRADVRQVIHTALPDSLEAYYQEAGRAGRDGLPSRATLLYDPKDRALQEYFINQSRVKVQDLHAIFDSLPDGEASFSLNDLSTRTGQHPVQLKVGLAILERAGVILNLGEDGYFLTVQKREWVKAEMDQAMLHGQLHIENRRSQLELMIQYAESNECRRAIILKYFGDHPSAPMEDCCDNCLMKLNVPAAPEPGASRSLETMSHAERVPLIILDCVRRLGQGVGQTKLAQILHGSRAKDILTFHYDRNVYYKRLEVMGTKEILDLIRQLISRGYLKVIGVEYPVVHLTPSGQKALQEKENISLKLPTSLKPEVVQRSKARLAAGGTVEYSGQLLSGGLTPEQIARERGLAVNTIYGHLERLIQRGRVRIEQVAPEDMRLRVQQAIEEAGSNQGIFTIMALLPDSYPMGLVRCMLTSRKMSTPEPSVESALDAFLKAPHPRQLPGPWCCGWALDFHSRFQGEDWERSAVGDLVYRLKYESDPAALPALTSLAVELCRQHPDLIQVDAILAVPSSTVREVALVALISQALSVQTGLPAPSWLAKARTTRPQKEMHTLAQKRANVSGAFTVQSQVKGKRLLVVDDLFDSGATLEEITRLLKHHGALGINVLTLTRTIHTDS